MPIRDFVKIHPDELKSVLVAPAMASPRLIYLGKGGDPFTVRHVGRSVKDPGQAFFVPYRGNPVVKGPNLYAANPVKAGRVWNVYSGGLFAPGNQHDDIYLATTRDDTLTHGFSSIRKVIDHGGYNHVNDPSAVRLRDSWVMAMTAGAVGVEGCSILRSRDGIHWPPLTDRSKIIFGGAHVHVSSCARPSLIYNSRYKGGHRWRWELYFDGVVNGVAEQHLAVSTEPLPRHFTYVAGVGPFVDADIKLLNGQYIAAYRDIVPPPVWNIKYAISRDGIHFRQHGRLLVAPDPLASYDDCGVTNAGWAINQKGLITAVMYGGLACPWGVGIQQLGVALPQADVILFSGNVAHAHRQAISATAQRIDTHEYTRVDRIMIIQRPGSHPIINQKIHGTRGDAWVVK
ncbi:hypothetical protein [Streptomyces sp. NPDC007205]|uniref:hypothetical protein n=1 Tax=Streptomyces sp. NPDC007205 TaxID=3154316 RepID=UPI0033DAB959